MCAYWSILELNHYKFSALSDKKYLIVEELRPTETFSCLSYTLVSFVVLASFRVPASFLDILLINDKLSLMMDACTALLTTPVPSQRRLRRVFGCPGSRM